MTSSISGTAAPLPVPFSLSFHGALGSRLDKELATQRRDELAKQRAAKRKVQLEVETLALEWSKILLQRQIDDAINPATDPALAFKIREALLNRGVGRPKEQEDENADAKKQKGNSGAQEFLEMLAAISVAATVGHNVAPTPRIERDIGSGSTDENSLQSFLDGLEDDLEDGDE